VPQTRAADRIAPGSALVISATSHPARSGSISPGKEALAVDVRLTDEALALVRARGGAMALDFIPPIG
jgi:hypothetical protein